MLLSAFRNQNTFLILQNTDAQNAASIVKILTTYSSVFLYSHCKYTYITTLFYWFHLVDMAGFLRSTEAPQKGNLGQKGNLYFNLDLLLYMNGSLLVIIMLILDYLNCCCHKQFCDVRKMFSSGKWYECKTYHYLFSVLEYKNRLSVISNLHDQNIRTTVMKQMRNQRDFWQYSYNNGKFVLRESVGKNLIIWQFYSDRVYNMSISHIASVNVRNILEFVYFFQLMKMRVQFCIFSKVQVSVRKY